VFTGGSILGINASAGFNLAEVFCYNKAMSTYLYIDGENLRHYLEDVLSLNGLKNDHIDNVKVSPLIDKVLADIKVDKKIFYSAKLHSHPDFLKKSMEIIERQRTLKNYLEENGYEFIISGNVRPFDVGADGRKKVIFKEKGVDVKIAVDMVANTCDRKVSTVILCSSDSDLQPAVKEVRGRGIEVIYLGFEQRPNKGLTFTTNRTILIRNSEVLAEVKVNQKKY
jgi:uncharacterized LabA/DUF88 family protein